MKRFDPKKLQAAIDEAGLSPAKFAGHLMARGYVTCQQPRQLILNWLSGKNTPGSNKLAGISDVLQKPTDWFLSEMPDEEPVAQEA